MSLEEEIARWLCAFAKIDPDEIIADGGHLAWHWVAHYDVPKLIALLDFPAENSA